MGSSSTDETMSLLSSSVPASWPSATRPLVIVSNARIVKFFLRGSVAGTMQLRKDLGRVSGQGCLRYPSRMAIPTSAEMTLLPAEAR